MNARRPRLGDRPIRGRSTQFNDSSITANRTPAVHLATPTPAPRRGFSLIELLIVIVASVVLAGLLFPALTNLRENAHRVICASNQRQIGMAMFMYDRDFGGLPYTSQLGGEVWQPNNLNIAHIGGTEPRWDGIGLLFQTGYCRSSNCFYCPSHIGDHRAEKYLEDWYHPGTDNLHTNFHYCGDVEWEAGVKRDLSRALKSGDRMVLLTDALSSRADMNHADGLNMLYADGSVHWREGIDDIQAYIPMSSETTMSHAEFERYVDLWSLIEQNEASID